MIQALITVFTLMPVEIYKSQFYRAGLMVLGVVLILGILSAICNFIMDRIRNCKISFLLYIIDNPILFYGAFIFAVLLIIYLVQTLSINLGLV